MKISNFKFQIKRYWQELFLLFVVGVIFILNITPNAYLTGWDSLQTELNPILGIKRAFFSVWQEYQSFGLTAGMAHGADLIRAVFILPLTLLLPDWIVRYTFHVVMILIGGVGMLKLLRFILKNNNVTTKNVILNEIKDLKDSSHKAQNDNSLSPFPLLGSLFYMLNFAVIQLLFLPFEAFTVFYASLPWLIWIYIKLITKPYTLKPKQLLLFIILNLLATPAFVAQQLFVVYAFILSLLTFGLIISYKLRHRMNQEVRIKKQENNTLHDSKLILHDSQNKISSALTIIKRSVIAAFLIIVVNSFWLLPQGYFLFTNGSVVKESKINQIATSDVLYSNIDRGNLTDIIGFSGFFYDRLDQNQNYLFASWKIHRENPFMIGIILVLFAVVLLGIISKKRYHTPSSAIHIGFLLVFLLCSFALLGNTPGIKELNDLIRENSFINQIFRSPFTKFAVPLALSASYFFMIGAYTLTTFLTKHAPQAIKHMVVFLTTFVLGFFILFQALPVFQGQLFSSEMKVHIPDRYIELMNYFQNVDKNERIALLPDYTFWGWFHTDYGYNGSGYLWYGIEQPIVSRNFDYWSFESESYFWEIKNAVEAEDLEMMERIFEKYNIDYIIFDTSLLPIVATQKSLQYETLEQMLLQSKVLKVEKQWDNLMLFKRLNTPPEKSFMSLSKDVPNIGPNAKLINDDIAYKTYGTYMTSSTKPYDVYYPFLDLFTQTKHVSDAWTITESEANITVESMIPFNPSDGYSITTSSQTTVDLYDAETAVNYIVPFETTLTSTDVSIRFPKIRVDTFSPESAKIGYCLKEQGDLTTYQSQTVIDITTTQGATGCIEFTDSNLDQRYGYFVSTQTENVTGPHLYFYVLDTTKNQAYVEDRIVSNNEHYILGPHFNRGLGYSFTFQNTSYQHIPSTNRVFGLQVYLMPYEDIHGLELIRKQSEPIKKATFSDEFHVEKKNYYTYIVSLSARRSASSETLILNQAYQPGWKAYTLANSKWHIANGLMEMFPFFFGKELEDHVVINNWANGWNLPDSQPSALRSTLVIIYLPQYLQYTGFVFIIVTIIGLILHHRSKKDVI